MQEPIGSSGSRLRFERLLVIVGGGQFDAALLRQLAGQGAALVGADGGADAIAAAGLVPDAIIGDLDSIGSSEGWPETTRVVRVPEQITVDFEKALYSTSAPMTVALGMTGGRFDHTLAAVDAMARQARGRPIMMVDGQDVALALDRRFAFAVSPGERVSVHPLGKVRFRGSHGLKYPMLDLTLAPGVATGVSNEATDGPFLIEPELGQAPWLLILDKRHLRRLIAAVMIGAGR